MPTQNSGYPPAYAVAAVVNTDGSLSVDTEDGYGAFVPGFSGASGQLSGAIPSLPPTATISQTGGVTPLTAILVELRVMNVLLREQLGASPLDLNQMRADEFFNCFPTTGQV